MQVTRMRHPGLCHGSRGRAHFAQLREYAARATNAPREHADRPDAHGKRSNTCRRHGRHAHQTCGGQIVVPVPRHIDARGSRFSATWWMQPLNENQWEHAWAQR